MARTTVEDCIRRTPNHFELVLGIVSRAKAIDDGAPSDLPRENDRSIVHALREVSDGKHSIDLEADILRNLEEDEAVVAGETSIAPEEIPGPTDTTG